MRFWNDLYFEPKLLLFNIRLCEVTVLYESDINPATNNPYRNHPAAYLGPPFHLYPNHPNFFEPELQEIPLCELSAYAKILVQIHNMLHNFTSSLNLFFPLQDEVTLNAASNDLEFFRLRRTQDHQSILE